MTSSDGEQRLDGLSHGPQTNGVLGENCSLIKLFQAPYCVSDTSEDQKSLNVIDTSEERILHADRQDSEACLERITLQAHFCIGKDSTDSSEEQKDPNKLESTCKQVLRTDGKVTETCLRNALFQAPPCSRGGSFGTPQEQKVLFEINAPEEQIHHTTGRATETSLDKWLLPAPHRTSEDNFDTFEEQNGPNEIDAPAEYICYTPGKSPETYLGQRLFKEQHFIRENCSDTSSFNDKKSNEIVHYTARRASETCLGEQLLRVTVCSIEDISHTSNEQKDINDTNLPGEQISLEDIKASGTCSDKQSFLKPHCVSESFRDTSEKPEDSNEDNALAPIRAPKPCEGKKFFQTPLRAREDFPNTSQEQQVSNEVDFTEKHDYHAAVRSQETCSGSWLFQPFHCIRKDVSKNFEEQKYSNEIDAAAEQIRLADRSIPEAYLGKKSHSPHCARGDFLITHEEPEWSNEFNISTEEVNRPHRRNKSLETCLSRNLFKAPLCIRGHSSNISQDENGSNELDEAAQQVCLEAVPDQICLRKRYGTPHCFTHQFYGVPKEQNDANNRNTKAEGIHQAAGCDRRASGNHEKGAGELQDGSWRACHFRSLPRWLQDNDFLLSGHRPQLGSFWTCFLSAFRIHTETVNIWTHLAGCVLFVGIAVHFLLSTEQTTTWQDRLVFGAFLASVILCLGTSSVFHAASCHSEPVCRLLGKLDYCGIATLITGSFVPWLHYGFYCERRLRLFYSTLVATLGSLSAALSMSDGFGEPRFRRTRAGLFAGFGLSGVVPAAHYLVSKGWARWVGWLVLMAALYLLGAAVYASRVPERFFPGRCDILFQSHQIFHVLVVAAALVHYHGTRELASRVILYEECNSAID